ncbi:MAG: fructose-6-phosphate aldolase [Calditrichaeota bacterium]|nr:fructose-6-phosphate aldolase [Calditrichota bacterium]
MQFFIDSAEISDIEEALSLNLCDGVTTNPSLIARSGRRLKPVIQEIAARVNGPVLAEVVSTTTEGIVSEGREMAEWAENVVIKIPVTLEGLKAIRTLESDGIATGTTLVFSPSQALLAAKAGTHYVIPFVGRLDDISAMGVGLVAQVQEALSNYVFEAEVLAASIRNPRHVVECALAGVPIVTAPLSVYKQMVKHPLTDRGIQRFLADWDSAKKELHA